MNCLFSVLVLLVFASAARAGVEHGNPKPTFYNMAQNYYLNLQDTGLVVKSLPESQGLRIDVTLAYYENGHFIVSPKTPLIEGAYKICGESAIEESEARVYWIGKDCKDSFFIKKWDDLRQGVVGFRFPGKKKG